MVVLLELRCMMTLVVGVCCWLLGWDGYVVVGGGADVMIGGYGENDMLLAVLRSLW